MVDGLLLNYTHGFPPEMMDIVRDHAIPAVWINSKQESDCVYFDDLGAGREATRLLAERGHRAVAYVDYSHGPSFPTPHYSAGDRRAGYAEAMRAAGLAPRFIEPRSGFDVPSPRRIEAAEAWLGRADRPTGLVCYGPAEVTAVMVAAKGLRLESPRDFSMVTFGEAPIKQFGPHVTTLVTPEEALGREAVGMLLARIEGGERLSPRKVALQLREGQTCGPPPAKGSSA
jgi:LacI family transcriptional regulator